MASDLNMNKNLMGYREAGEKTTLCKTEMIKHPTSRFEAVEGLLQTQCLKFIFTINKNKKK